MTRSQSSLQSTNGRIPRDRDNDYTAEIISARRQFIEQRTDASLRNVSSYSLDPAILPGSVENFVGVARVPIGVVGPLLVHGEHARVSSTFPWRPRRGRWLPVTTAVCDWSGRPAG